MSKNHVLERETIIIHVLTKVLIMLCFLAGIYILYTLIYVDANLFVILPELLLIMLSLLIVSYRYRNEKKSEDFIKRLKNMKIFMMVSIIIWIFSHHFIKLLIVYSDLNVVFYYVDILIYSVMIYLALLLRKYDIILHQDVFNKPFKKGVLGLLRPLFYLTILLLIIGLGLYLFSRFHLSNTQIGIDLFWRMMISLGLFTLHYGLFVLYEYMTNQENTYYLKSKQRSYTSWFAFVTRCVVFILVLGTSFLYLLSSFYRYQGTYLIDYNQKPWMYVLSIEISILTLIFYGTFFNGILKLKRPGNKHIRYVIMIIMFDFIINFMIGLIGLLGLTLNQMVSFYGGLSLLGIFQTINSILLLFVGLAVYDYFKHNRFPKIKYFLYAVLLQPTKYAFNYLSLQFINENNIYFIAFLQQLYVVILLISTSLLSLITIYHMSKEKTDVYKQNYMIKK